MSAHCPMPGGRRRSTPSSHNGSTTCNVQLVGTGAQWGVKSAHLSCSTTDEFWLQSSTGTVTVRLCQLFIKLPVSNPAVNSHKPTADHPAIVPILHEVNE
jgi:hypothetical protein